LWGIVIWFNADLDVLRAQINLRRTTHEFIDLVRHGLLIGVQGYVLVAYFLFDRLIINSYYHDYSSEYALSFSLAQMIFIAVNTVAFAVQHKIGVNLNQFSKKSYNQMLATTFILLAFLLMVTVLMIYLFGWVVNGYGDFINSFVLIAVFFGGYYTISAFAVIGLYKGMASKALFILVMFLILNILITLVFINYNCDYYDNLSKSGLLLLISAVVFDKMIRREFDRRCSA